MTARSANRWPVLTEPPPVRVIPGTPVRVTVRPGDVATVLLEVARRFHEEVERLDLVAVDRGQVVPTDDWGWAWRPVRGQTSGFSNHASGTACFAGDTEIVTRDGIRTLHELAGTEAVILTRDPSAGQNGRWVPAPIRSFGVQQTRVITLSRFGRRMQIRATGDHRWFVRRKTKITYSDGGRTRTALRERIHEVTTDTLLVGDTLPTCRVRAEARRAQPAPLGVAHGVVFGDGSLTRTAGACVALFGPKVELLRYFPEPRVTVRSRSDSLVETYVDNLPRHFKALPPEGESTQYLLGWLAGLIATDGHVSAQQIAWSTASEEAAAYVRDLCPRLGIGMSQREVKRGSDAYAPGSDIRTSFVRSTLGPEFFVRHDQRDRFGEPSRAEAPWRVESITDGVEEPVFCATVPETGAFTLAGDILTGNCDLNATLHPRGVRGTFKTRRQLSAIRRILASTFDAKAGRNVVRWGGDYKTTVDEMHFEIDADAAAVARVATRILAKKQPRDLLEEIMAATPAEQDAFARKVAALVIPGVVAQLTPPLRALLARDEDGLYIRVKGTRPVYQVVGGVRVWVDADEYEAYGRPEVQEVPADDPLMRLRLVGQPPPGGP